MGIPLVDLLGGIMTNLKRVSRTNKRAAHYRLAVALLGSTCLCGGLIASPVNAQTTDSCSLNPGGLTTSDPITFELADGYIYSNMPPFYAICDGPTGTEGPSITVTNTSLDEELKLLGNDLSTPAALGASSKSGGDITATNLGNIYVQFTGLAGISEGSASKPGGTVTGTNSGSIEVEPVVADQDVFNGTDTAISKILNAQGDGMYLASIGGNGTAGVNNSGGHYVVGGAGGVGGDGGSVTATNAAPTTTGYAGLTHSTIFIGTDMGDGIVGMSVGGGGGDGGSAAGHAYYTSVAIGGNGGNGGNGGTVNVQNDAEITLLGWNSIGIKAMSIGGGGGQGGGAHASSSAFAGIGGTFSMSTGGQGGAGGDGGAVSVTQSATGSIQTGGSGGIAADPDKGETVAGDFSPGILAQSIGGGGGNGGQSFTSAKTQLIGVSVSIGHGGQGNSGGDGKDVDVSNAGSIVTGGRLASGIIAQSVGGGGGNGGMHLSGADQKSIVSVDVTVANGGDGGAGGKAGEVTVENSGKVVTYGTQSRGIVAQSIGGGGGNGGSIVESTKSSALYAVTATVSMGGKAKSAGSGGPASVSLTSGSSVTTYGDDAGALLVQSIGGGGGTGGSIHTFSQDIAGGDVKLDPNKSPIGSLAVNATVGIGGSGSKGGDGGAATGTISGAMQTYGAASAGAVIQSIGGGGGAGGHVSANTVTQSYDNPVPLGTLANSAFTVGVSIGGSGGGGGDAGAATANLANATIETSGPRSHGVVVQAIGGGGGMGGSTHTTAILTSIPTSPLSLATRYTAKLPGSAVTAKGNLQATVEVGGRGGTAGNGSSVIDNGDGTTTITGVNVNIDGGSITTTGHMSHGLVAQSIGGGGGIGGSTHADGFVSVGTLNLTGNINGKGGGGGKGGDVTVAQAPGNSNPLTITTSGDLSYGVLAQSIGGGGGEGGSGHVDFSKAGDMLAKSSYTGTVGGAGGAGNSGGSVNVSAVTVMTGGTGAHAILAQSIGGGGGAGGSSIATGKTSITLGGEGGDGNDGGTVSIHDVNATTTGNAAAAIVAQSIGGGGGHVGQGKLNDIVDDTETDLHTSFTFATSGSAGNGGAVNVGCAPYAAQQVSNCSVNVGPAPGKIGPGTSGATAIGILAQSIGGGGGTAQASLGNLTGFDIVLDTQASGTGASGLVSIIDDQEKGLINVSTQGDGAIGIVAQSIDSGGGALIFDDLVSSSITFSGGTGAVNSNGGTLINLNGSVSTGGKNASAIYAQSLSNAFTVFDTSGPAVYGGFTVNTARNMVFLNSDSDIETTGDYSNGVEVVTNSTASSAFTPSVPPDPTLPATRAQTIAVQGTITTSGANAWGVYSTNGGDMLDIPAGEVTTHVQVAQGGMITANNATGGGIYVADYGRAVAEVLGVVSNTSGTAISLISKDSTLIVNPLSRYNGVVYGDVFVAGIGPNSIGKVQMDGTINGTLTVQGNSDGNFTIKGRGFFGSYLSDSNPYFTLTPNGAQAIVVDQGVTSIGAGIVTGDIVGPAVGTVGMADPIPLDLGTMSGSITGNFAVTYGNGDQSIHSLGIDAAGGHIDTINVAKFQQGGPGGGLGLYLQKLPTAAFKSVTLITVADGMAPGSPQSVFGLLTNTAVTNFDVTVTTPDSGPATAVLNKIDIDFTRATSGGNLQQVAVLANKQLAAIASGAVVPDTNSDLYKKLLTDTQLLAASDVQNSLTALEPSLHYGTSAAAEAGQQQGISSMYSCGGTVTASVDPISQGECNWAKFLTHDSSRASVGQKYHADGFAMGHQIQVGDVLYLGFAASYEATRARSTSAASHGNRIGLGSVLKYTQGDNFGSVALHASFDWTEGSRSVVLPASSGTRLARMDQEVALLATQLRLGHRLVRKPFDLILQADLDAVLVHDFGYTEYGAGSLNMRVDPETGALFNFHPVVQIGKHIAVGKGGLRLYGEVGPRFAFNDIRSKAALASGFDSNYTVSIRHHRERTTMTYGLGMIMDITNRLEMRINYDLQDGSDFHSEEFGVKMALKF